MVPRVARMRPGKPLRTSFGSRPLWSIWAWVSRTASMSAARKGNAPVVQLLQGLLSLKQAAIDQEASGSGLKEIAGARHGARRAAKPDRDAHRDVSGMSASFISLCNASTNRSSSAMALVECGTLCVERIERMPDTSHLAAEFFREQRVRDDGVDRCRAGSSQRLGAGDHGAA